MILLIKIVIQKIETLVVTVLAQVEELIEEKDVDQHLLHLPIPLLPIRHLHHDLILILVLTLVHVLVQIIEQNQKDIKEKIIKFSLLLY